MKMTQCSDRDIEFKCHERWAIPQYVAIAYESKAFDSTVRLFINKKVIILHENPKTISMEILLSKSTGLSYMKYQVGWASKCDCAVL